MQVKGGAGAATRARVAAELGPCPNHWPLPLLLGPGVGPRAWRRPLSLPGTGLLGERRKVESWGSWVLILPGPFQECFILMH